MDTDRFFSLGPGMPFEVNDVFTNRADYIAAFLERLQEHQHSTLTVRQLIDFHHPARNVMTLIGEGGIGKSALLRHLANLTVEGALPELGQNRRAVIVDF